MDENDEGGVIYEQEYTIEELREIGESGVILSNKETKMNYENLSFTFDKFELENINEEKPSTHYAIKIDNQSFTWGIKDDSDDKKGKKKSKNSKKVEEEEIEEEHSSFLDLMFRSSSWAMYSVQ